MDFFSSQSAARRNTKRLLAYFVAAVLMIITAIYLLVMVTFGSLSGSEPGGSSQPKTVWDGEVFFVVACFTLLLIGLGSLYRIATLRQGGRRVAEMLGGKPIRATTRDLKEKRLLNIVEEMSIAAGISVPPVYLMEKEEGINAFAAGFKPDDAVIGVTRGTIENLSRDELQGVIAHEFSHIFNGDMRLNIRLIGMLHGILLISLVGRTILENADLADDDNGKGALALFVFAGALMAIGYVGVFFGRLIKSAVSRQREFLADASAVQFTRNPEGISGALKKIGGLGAGSRMLHPKSEALSHMFFGNGLKRSPMSMFATHPPLKERIQRLDPHFDGTYPVVRKLVESESSVEDAPGRASGVPPIIPVPLPIPLPDVMKAPVLAAMAALPDALVNTIGSPGGDHIEAARKLMEIIPAKLLEELHDPQTARALTYALLISRHDAIEERQWSLLADSEDLSHFEMTTLLHEQVEKLPRTVWLPLAQLCLPALHEQSVQQYNAYRTLVHQLIEADEIVSLFEYALQHLVLRSLDTHFGLLKATPKTYTILKDRAAEATAALSILARWGHEAEPDAAKAFRVAVDAMTELPHPLELLDVSECTLPKMDEALSVLRDLVPRDKKQFILACFRCLSHDEQIRLVEAELFRAIGAALDCPIPLWLGLEKDTTPSP